MKKIEALITASILILTIVGACFSAGAAIQVVCKVQQPQQQPQHGGENGTGTIAGTIYDKYANPVDKAIVMLFPGGKFLPSQIVSSDNGAYIFNAVPTGQYRIVAAKPLINGSGSTTAFIVNEGATLLRNVYLTHGFGGSGGNYSGENGTIAGTIYDENGGPVDEAYVLLVEKGKILPYDYNISAADGSYGFVNVPPGQYRIIATKPLIDGSGSTTLFVVSPGATTTIDVYLNNFVVGGGNQEIQGQQQQMPLKQQVLLSK